MKNYISRHRFPWIHMKKAVRIYKKGNISFRDVANIMEKDGVLVSPKTIYEWVNKFSSMINITTDEIKDIVKRKGEDTMKVWYYDIPKGTYTTQEIVDLSKPKQTYACVYHTFRRLKVESFREKKEKVDYNKRNEKKWKWKGAKFYLKLTAADVEEKKEKKDTR